MTRIDDRPRRSNVRRRYDPGNLEPPAGGRAPGRWSSCPADRGGAHDPGLDAPRQDSTRHRTMIGDGGWKRARQTYVAQIDFVLRDHVPNEFVRVNPLGLQVTYFRVDQAFEEANR